MPPKSHVLEAGKRHSLRLAILLALGLTAQYGLDPLLRDATLKQFRRTPERPVSPLLNGLITNADVRHGVVAMTSTSNQNTLWSGQGKTIRPPFLLEAAIIPRKGGKAFDLHFAETDHGAYSLSYTRQGLRGGGVFFQRRSGSRERVAQWAHKPGERSAGVLKMSLRCTERSLEIVLNGQTIRLRPTAPIHTGLLRLYIPVWGGEWDVDRFEIREERAEGGARITGGGFSLLPLNIDTARALGMQRDSRQFRMLSTSLLFTLGLLLDLALLCLFPYCRRFSLSWAGFLALFWPLQAALLYGIKACLSLPEITLYLSVALIVMAKALGVMRQGFGARDHRHERGPKVLFLAALLTGVIVYLASLRGVLPLFGDPGSEYPAYGGWVVALLPVAALLGALCLSTQNGALVALVVALQTHCGTLMDLFESFDHHLLIVLLAPTPWLLGTLVDALTAPGGVRGIGSRYFPRVLRGPVRAGFALAIGLALLWSLEMSVRRSVDLIHLKGKILKLGWDVEHDTDLLGTQQQIKERTFNSKRVSKEKPARTYRILCLGSSSTAGLGSSDRDRFGYPAQLEQMLNHGAAATPALGPTFEVINGGVPSAPFLLLQVYFEEALLSFKPDLLVIYFGANGDTQYVHSLYARLKKEVSQAPFLETEEDLWAAMLLRWNPRWLLRGFLQLSQSRLFLFTLLLVKQIKAGVGLGLSEDPHDVADPSIYRQSVERVVRLSTGRGIKVLLIPEICKSHFLEQQDSTFHSLSPFKANCALTLTLFKEIAGAHAPAGVYFLDLYQGFDKDKARSLLVDEMHLNDRGYRYLAREIIRHLTREGALPAATPSD